MQDHHRQDRRTRRAREVEHVCRSPRVSHTSRLRSSLRPALEDLSPLLSWSRLPHLRRHSRCYIRPPPRHLCSPTEG